MKWTCASTSPGNPSDSQNAGTSASELISGVPLGPAAHGAVDLPGGVAGGERLPLVVGALAAGESDLYLRLAVLEVERQRHERQAALLRLPDELRDLLAVQQQLARAARLVVGPRALVVLRDVRVLEPHLAVLHVGVGVDQRRATRAQRLDLGSLEHEPGLEHVLQVVVVPGLLVLRDQLAAGLLRHGQPRPLLPASAVSPDRTSTARSVNTAPGDRAGTSTSGCTPTPSRERPAGVR